MSLNAPTPPRLLTEQECKELTRMMNFIMRRIDEIRPYLTLDSVLSEYLTKLCEEFKMKIKNRLLQYQEVLIQHTIFALKKIDKGVLCVNVYQKIENTPIEVVMRGLLNPKEIRDTEDVALSKAEKDTDLFQKNVEFLVQIIRKGPYSSVSVKKMCGLKVIRENFEELQHAKDEYDRVQEEIAAAALAAEEEERERQEKEAKMKKLGRV